MRLPLYLQMIFRIKDVLKRENEERQRELRDLEAFVKKENAERKAAEEQIQSVLNAENEKRMKEAAALKDKMEREKKEMQVCDVENNIANMVSMAKVSQIYYRVCVEKIDNLENKVAFTKSSF